MTTDDNATQKVTSGPINKLDSPEIGDIEDIAFSDTDISKSAEEEWKVAGKQKNHSKREVKEFQQRQRHVQSTGKKSSLGDHIVKPAEKEADLQCAVQKGK